MLRMARDFITTIVRIETRPGIRDDWLGLTILKRVEKLADRNETDQT